MVVALKGSGPQPPVITKKDIWDQFKIDIAGKEVQTAETYSHSWIANQFGHVCLGLLLASMLSVTLGSGLSLVIDWLGFPASWKITFPWYDVAGSLLAIIGVAAWEWRAYSIAVKGAAGRFPLDRRLLRENAITATIYMVLGVAMAFVFRYFAFGPYYRMLGLPPAIWGSICFLALIVIGILLAVPWLRQKITWQKAALPFLFRLADAHETSDAHAQMLQALIDSDPPPDVAARQIVIGGPIGSGRTEFCAGIGTEFAFRKRSVRYLSLSTLLEFAAQSDHPKFFDDTGPANIAYWEWSRAQVLIIDDIGPLLAAKAHGHDNHLQQFGQVLNNQLSTIRPVLERCHTVWVIGDPRGDGAIAQNTDALDGFARQVGEFCNPRDARQPVVVVQLNDVASAPNPKVPRGEIRYVEHHGSGVATS